MAVTNRPFSTFGTALLSTPPDVSEEQALSAALTICEIGEQVGAPDTDVKRVLQILGLAPDDPEEEPE